VLSTTLALLGWMLGGSPTFQLSAAVAVKKD
jgi:hypothetical protein